MGAVRVTRGAACASPTGPAVRLGRVIQRIADTARRMIEALVAAKRTCRVFVFPDVRSGAKNARAGPLHILAKAGIPAWAKLFQPPRASRETELMRLHPARLVHAWVGNTERAEDHSLMATDEDLERAAGKATRSTLLRQ